MKQNGIDYEVRTDLALEASEGLKESGGAGDGIVLEEYHKADDIRVTCVRKGSWEAKRDLYHH